MSTLAESPFDAYTRTGYMTDLGDHAAPFTGLPATVAELAAITGGLIIHELVASAYGIELTPAERATAHTRRVGDILSGITARDPRPLTTTRPPCDRFVGNCRTYTLLLVAMLRANGVPARARCGFADYFPTERGEDHWVCEYRDARTSRWKLADAQLDATQRDLFGIDFDTLDIPREHFTVAGEAWARVRAGSAPADSYGISALSAGGDWVVAGNLLRDFAALNNMEMLPWDVWGPMPLPGTTIDAATAADFDRLAALTRDPDTPYSELAAAYDTEERLRVPDTVYNALREQPERI